jgi:hypothetical protein
MKEVDGVMASELCLRQMKLHFDDETIPFGVDSTFPSESRRHQR